MLDVHEPATEGLLAELPEVARRGDQPAAEVVHPHTVDDHPRQQVTGAAVDPHSGGWEVRTSTGASAPGT